MDEYYERLGITRHATAEEVTRAYRRVSLRCHPDKGGSEVRFKEVNEAYEVLNDEKRRAGYDRFGLDLGDDGTADDLAVEIGTHANQAMGIAFVRTLIAGTVCVCMGRNWFRVLFVASCAIAAVYGRLRGGGAQVAERAAYRLVVVPLLAWAAAYLERYEIFEALVNSTALGVLEVDNNAKRLGLVALGVAVRWLFGSRPTVYLKFLLFFVVVLVLGHFFFLLVAALANQLIEHKLNTAGKQVRAILAQSQKDICDLRKQLDDLMQNTNGKRNSNNAGNHQLPAASSASSTGPTRRTKNT